MLIHPVFKIGNSLKGSPDLTLPAHDLLQIEKPDQRFRRSRCMIPAGLPAMDGQFPDIEKLRKDCLGHQHLLPKIADLRTGQVMHFSAEMHADCLVEGVHILNRHCSPAGGFVMPESVHQPNIIESALAIVIPCISHFPFSNHAHSPGGDAIDMAVADGHHHVNAASCNLSAHRDPPISGWVQCRFSGTIACPQHFQNQSRGNAPFLHSLPEVRYQHMDVATVQTRQGIHARCQLFERGLPRFGIRKSKCLATGHAPINMMGRSIRQEDRRLPFAVGWPVDSHSGRQRSCLESGRAAVDSGDCIRKLPYDWRFSQFLNGR